MYIEKNVCSSPFKTFTNAEATKANLETQRIEMENMGIMKDLWIKSRIAPALTS